MKSRGSALIALAIVALFAARDVGAQSAPEAGAAQLTAGDDQLGNGPEAIRKGELVTTILAARETASGRRFSTQLRALLGDKLRSADLATLEAFQSAGGLGDIDALARAPRPYTVGDSAADLMFTPVTPCRIVDTRVAGGQIAANTTRNFYVNGSTGGTFETQGGTAGGCGIPDNATAVEMNFVAVSPAGPGNLQAYPYLGALPIASVINYASANIANGIAQPVCNAATTACTFDLTVRANASAVQLVVDVVGYFQSGKFASNTAFVEGPAQSTTTTAVTITQASVTVGGPGRIIAIGSAEAFCDAGCSADSDFVSAYMNITTTSGGSPQAAPRSFFFTKTNQSNSLTRTLQADVGSAGTYTLYLRGQRSAGVGTTIGFYRGQLQLFFLPN